jgi:hypothetical protein
VCELLIDGKFDGCRRVVVEKQKVETLASILHELGLSYRETATLVNEVTRELQFSRRLWKRNNSSALVKLGLTLIAIPDPFVVTDVAGAALVVASMIQTKVKNSGLHVEDVCKMFPKLLRELDALKQDVI